MDCTEDVPTDGVGGQQVSEDLGNDPQHVRVFAMDLLVVADELLFKDVYPHSVEFAETFSDQTEKLVVGPLL